MSSQPPREKPAAPHASVLRDECIRVLEPQAGKVFVDATLGAGGHTEALLAHPATHVIGIDRDDTALAIARARLERYGTRVTLVKARFSEIADVLTDLGIASVDGLLADVGVSSMQLDQGDRGMSFRQDGPLDMRMDTSSGETALDLVARLDDDELADVIYKLGEERRSRRVARCIKRALEAGELATTFDLRRAVVRAVGPARVGGVDPSTRTFQALRIAVNDELGELTRLCEAARTSVRVGGVFAVISFHSLEDRIVKHAMRERTAWEPLFKKPLVATPRELEDNPRARSAKLRAARRVDGVWEGDQGDGAFSSYEDTFS